MTDYVAISRRLLSPHFATDGEEDGPEDERIAQAVETLIGSIAEALSVAREEGRQEERKRCTQWARLYWDGDLADDYVMFTGIRDGTEPGTQFAKQPDDHG